MKNLLFSLPLLILMAGCGDDLSSHKGIAEAQADAYNDLADVMDGIKDKSSAESARSKVESIMKRIHAAEEASGKITAELKIEDMQEISNTIEAARKKQTDALMRLADRIKNDPEAQAICDKMFQ